MGGIEGDGTEGGRGGEGCRVGGEGGREGQRGGMKGERGGRDGEQGWEGRGGEEREAAREGPE